MLTKKIPEVNQKANPIYHLGNRSDLEKESKNYPEPLKPTSVRMIPIHSQWIDQQVKSGKFQNKSEAFRYCIQFVMDLETIGNVLAIEILTLLKRNGGYKVG